MTEQMLWEFHSWICKPLSNQKRLIDKMDVSQLAIAENTWMDAWQAATLVEQGKRQPLTDEQIEALISWIGDPSDLHYSRIEHARAIESAHGITATPQGNPS